MQYDTFGNLLHEDDLIAYIVNNGGMGHVIKKARITDINDDFILIYSPSNPVHKYVKLQNMNNVIKLGEEE